MSVAILEAALSYARRDWRVFPLHSIREGACTCGNPDCDRAGKHPRTWHGLKDASIDERQIAWWWKRYPTANVGIATGAPSETDALDVDPRHDGEESLAQLEFDHGQLPETATSITGSAGLHVLFAHPRGRSVPNRKNLGGYQGLDLKGDGGYIVAPPSLHASGREYAWNVLLHPDDVPLAPLPEILLRLADGTKHAPCATYRHVPWDGKVPPRVGAALREDPRLRARFYRQAARLSDSSPSGIDFSLAARLARRRLSGAEIEAAIRASRARAQLPERPATYYAATVGKALGGARA